MRLLFVVDHAAVTVVVSFLSRFPMCLILFY